MADLSRSGAFPIRDITGRTPPVKGEAAAGRALVRVVVNGGESSSLSRRARGDGRGRYRGGDRPV